MSPIWKWVELCCECPGPHFRSRGVNAEPSSEMHF